MIALIDWMSVFAVNAQPISPSSETTSAQPQQNSYVGFGGVVGLQGSTTSLSQGSFSVLHKHVLNESLAIHSVNAIEEEETFLSTLSSWDRSLI